MHRAIRIALFFALIYCILYAEINSGAIITPEAPGSSTRSESGREPDEGATSGTISAASAHTTRKKEGVHLRDEEALWNNVSPPSTSPQCQRTTHTKDNNLEGIERPLYTVSYRDHRLEN
jgi:hypothetical protein